MVILSIIHDATPYFNIKFQKSFRELVFWGVMTPKVPLFGG